MQRGAAVQQQHLLAEARFRFQSRRRASCSAAAGAAWDRRASPTRSRSRAPPLVARAAATDASDAARDAAKAGAAAEREASSSRWQRLLGRVLDWLDGPPPTANTWEGSAPVELPPVEREGLEQAVFAGGCFWGVEAAFAAAPGVVATECGYTGGREPRPTYSRVCGGRTGHAEAVRVVYDPRVTSYGALLELFWSLIDATDARGQGADRGSQYRTAVFWCTPAQRDAAAAGAAALQARLGRRVWTAVLPAAPWFPAEAEHQRYFARGGLDPAPATPHWLGGVVDLD